MQTFTFIPNPLPYGQGVYALTHHKTESVYIGSTTNLRGRASEWASTMRTKKAKLKRFPSTNPKEYEFRLLLRTENKTEEEIRNHEANIIERVRTSGFKLINLIAPQVKKDYLLDGLWGSVTFHASRLGRHPAQALDRMRRGATLEQALSDVQFHSGYNEREATLSRMPVTIKLDGVPSTYAELAEYWGLARESVREKVKRARARQPDRTEFDADLDF